MAQARVILPSERVVDVGKTGSGKSYLASRYTLAYENVICLDTKGDSLTREGLKKLWPHAVAAGIKVPIFTRLAELQKFRGGRAVYAPEPQEMRWEYFDAFFWWIYERKNTVCWVDEVYSVTQGQEITPGHQACLTRGRSRGVGMWNCTQRPKNIPNVIFSESEHFFVFRLLLGTDRKKVAEWAGEEVMTPPPGEHGFWYYGIHMDRPVLLPEGLEI